jgi:hypothetical protein
MRLAFVVSCYLFGLSGILASRLAGWDLSSFLLRYDV